MTTAVAPSTPHAPSKDHLFEGAEPSQLSAEGLRSAEPGALFDHYHRSIPWLRPYWEKGRMPERETERKAWVKAIACEGGWTPLASAWGPTDSQALWRAWERLLPLIQDETVQEIWVQRLVNGDSPTPKGYLDVLSDGLLGVRLHPELRMEEEALLTGFTRILSKSANGSYYTDTNTNGRVIIESPLEAPGFRLAGGVPPVSVAPFIALRIPARERPEIEHLIGAKTFGQGYSKALVCPGKPLPIPKLDVLAHAKEALATNGPQGDPMFTMEVLEYLRCAAKVGWNKVFSGATSSAKTTTLNAEVALLPLYWRIVTMEKGVGELKPPHINWIPLFANPDLKNAAGEPLMDETLVLSLALRLSPKPIISGEIRGVEGELWRKATSTGHESSATTVHAGNPDEAIMRIAIDMVLKANPGMDEDSARLLACRAANVVIQLAKEDVLVDGRIVALRRCIGVYEIQMTGSYIGQDLKAHLVEVFSTVPGKHGKPTLAWVGNQNGSNLKQLMEARLMQDYIPAWM